MFVNFTMKHERRVLTLTALLSLNCNTYCQEQTKIPSLPLLTIEDYATPSLYPIDVSFDFATGTGLELEKNYQEQLRTQSPGRHIIIVGDYGKPGGGLYIGNVGASVQTLRSNLRGNVEVWRYPRDVSSGSDILEKIEINTGAPITSMHLYGHGDSSEYWLELFPTDNSLTIELLNSLDKETRENIHDKFAPDGYIKFYGCHVAAASDYENDTNVARTTAEVLGVPTIGANSWVFIEVPHANYMYPVSRKEYERYFTKEKSDYGVEIPDSAYTGESAWITYKPASEVTAR